VEQCWLLLQVSREVEVAVELSRVHRVLHRRSPGFEAHAAQALALARYLKEPPDPSLPGVVVVLSSGANWYAGDAGLGSPSRGLAFRPVPPDLLSESPPWCRGVLAGDGHWAYVLEPGVLEASHG
jgi:hypothetical protein